MTVWFSHRYSEEISDCKPLYVEWLIYVAKEFEYLNNYNGLMAVVLAWNQITLPKLEEELLMEMKTIEETMNMMGNFKEYRKLISDSKSPCVPFLGLFIKDLYFIEEGNKSMLDNLINITKLTLISEKLKQFKIWQLKPYIFYDTKEGMELYDILYCMK